MKILMVVGIQCITLSFSIYSVFLFGIISKYLSMLFLTFQLVLIFDLLNHLLLPLLPSLLTSGPLLFFSLAVPSISSLSLLLYNLYAYSSSCTLYLWLTILLTFCSLLLLLVSLMRLDSLAPLICTLWYLTLIQVVEWSVFATTSHTTCGGGVDVYGDWEKRTADVAVAIFVALGTGLWAALGQRNKGGTSSERKWIFWWVLGEEGNRYVRFEKEKEVYKGKMVEMLDFKELKELNNAVANSYWIQPSPIKISAIEVSKDRRGVSKVYRSTQAAVFHLLMCLFSCYYGVIMISWIHLSVNLTNTGSISDDISIWIRISSLLLAMLFIIIRQIMIHYEKGKEFKTWENQHESDSYSEADP